MHQKNNIGGGIAEDDKYITWELKECGTCKRNIIEYYEARLIEQPLLGDLLSGETIQFSAELKSNNIKIKGQ